MHSHDPPLDERFPAQCQESSNPIADFGVAMAGLVILALCWALVWVLLSRSLAEESASLGAGLWELLEGSIEQWARRGVGPTP